jgi:SusD/RagB-like outer membrane lipoprotein
MKKFSIITIAASLLLASCTKNIGSLNKDPKSATTPVGTALFLQGEMNLSNALTTTSIGIAPFRVLSQEWSENSYVYEANYQFGPYNAPGGFWDNLYVNSIHNLELAKQAFPLNFLGTPGALKNDLLISDILEVYAYSVLVTTYGNIPYSQAQQDSIPFPKYDDAKTVFSELLTRLDGDINGISLSDGAMGNSDQIYYGNSAAWKKFAASLKLKLALMLADVDPTTSTTKVNEAISTGVFASNADNAQFSWDPASPNNSNPIWIAISYSGRHDFGPADLLVNTMVGWHDPRLSQYFTQFNGAYVGGQPGNANNSYGAYSDFGPQLYSASLPGDILDNAEIQFYLAEAAARGFIPGGPTAYYDSAISSSIQFWEGSSYNPNDVTTYLAQPAVNYATATGTWQQKIGYQEWIAYYNRNWESWTVIRRLGYPNINVVSPPQQAATTLPLRFYYPPNEVTSNATNWAAAAAALPGGQDVVTAKLFFMP